MINGNIEDFLDMIYYGEDVYLIYKGNRLFIDGWKDDGKYTLRMIDFGSKNKKSTFNFEITNIDKNEVIKDFLNKKIWDGKTFYEEVENIEWSEPFESNN